MRTRRRAKDAHAGLPPLSPLGHLTTRLAARVIERFEPVEHTPQDEWEAVLDGMEATIEELRLHEMMRPAPDDRVLTELAQWDQLLHVGRQSLSSTPPT